MTSTPSFHGACVLAFESRRAKEIDALITTFHGRPLVAPAMREVPNESDDSLVHFARALVAGRFDAVIFLTGVGVRALVDAVDRAGFRSDFLRALVGTRVVTRGPKPVSALRDLGVPVWVNAPEPNTWRELMAALDSHESTWPLAGKRVAVQEYGVSNVDLLAALRASRAEVTTVQAYQWAMPDDLQPLVDAARAVANGEVAVILITSGIQFVHFWRVVVELSLERGVQDGLSGVVLASIGPSASAELRRHGVEPTFEPSHPKMGLLVREAAEHLAQCM